MSDTTQTAAAAPARPDPTTLSEAELRAALAQAYELLDLRTEVLRMMSSDLADIVVLHLQDKHEDVRNFLDNIIHHNVVVMPSGDLALGGVPMTGLVH